MYSSENTSSPIGKAWAFHRIGQNDAALVEFDTILRQSPGDIDANFGIGLVQRALGQYDAASASFQKVLELVERALEKEPEADRWEMLQRMGQQRIAEINQMKTKAAD